MLGRLLGWRSGTDDADDEESTEDRRNRFLRSRLDASVLYAHGMGDTLAEQEIIGLEEKERLVEEHRRRRE